ncbi:MAG: two-component regulator propeller domain-containing protein [Ignavibacteriaceae bacterium]
MKNTRYQLLYFKYFTSRLNRLKDILFRHFVFSIICFLFSPFILSQQREINFERISIEQGLSQSTVHSIIQDKQGFIWIATEDGLNRYDGYNFSIYRNDRDDLTSIVNNQIRVLLQDKKGTIWAGTGEGLSALSLIYDAKDGKNKEGFFNFIKKENDTTSLSDNNIRCLYEDKFGVIWIGTTNGLNRIETQTSTSSDENYLSKIKFSNNSFTKSFSALTSAEFISSITEDGNGNLWFGTMGNGLIVYNRKSKSVINYKKNTNDPNSLGSNYIIKLYTDLAGRVWIGTYGGGLNRFDHQTKKFVKYISNPDNPNSISENKIYDIVDDNNGNLWIGTFSGGLNKLDPKLDKFINYKNNKQNSLSLSNDFIRCLLIDRSGNLWVGTNNGINKTDLKSPKFITLKNNFWDSNSLSDNFVLSIYEAQNNKLWIGTNSGLDIYDSQTNKFTHHKISHNNPNSNEGFVYSIIEDEQEFIWLGTFGGGLIKCDSDGRILKQYLHDDKNNSSIIDNRINKLYKLSNGDLVIGTVVGVCVWQKKYDNFRSYLFSSQDSTKLSGKSIEIFYRDRNDVYWIGTESGLVSVDPSDGNCIEYLYDENNLESISSNTITTICEDLKGNLWIGTENGLNKMDRKNNRFKVFTTKDGLPNNYINSVIDDEDGNLWIATNRGISRYSESNSEGKQFRNYFTDDGLQGLEFNINSVFKNSKGEIYFGGTNGLNKFNPSIMRDNPNQPQIAIVSFIKAGEKYLTYLELSRDEEIILTSDENIFSFEFSAFDYTNPKKNQYTYKLEGFDSDWIVNGNNRFANYTNIDPGEYTFMVKASNNDGIWNENAASLKVIIKPPIYKTWIAYSIYLILGFTVLYFIRKYEVNKRKVKNELLLNTEKEKNKLVEIQLRAEKAELQTKALESEKELEKQIIRSRIASDLHDEIGSNLSSITLLSSIMMNKVEENPEIKKQMLDINFAAKSSTESIRDIIWFINPTSDKLSSLFSRIKETTNFMLSGLDYKLILCEVNQDEKINPELKRNLYLIYKETLNNIVKHSAAKNVMIDFSRNQNKLKVFIKDDGIGFDQNSIKEGNGLKNIKARAEQISASIEIISSEKKGTAVNLEVVIT